jgi:hypothetical protein
VNGGEPSRTIKFPMRKAFTKQAHTVALFAVNDRHYLMSRRASSDTASRISATARSHMRLAPNALKWVSSLSPSGHFSNSPGSTQIEQPF